MGASPCAEAVELPETDKANTIRTNNIRLSTITASLWLGNCYHRNNHASETLVPICAQHTFYTSRGSDLQGPPTTINPSRWGVSYSKTGHVQWDIITTFQGLLIDCP